jgi:hypothetical protein
MINKTRVSLKHPFCTFVIYFNHKPACRQAGSTKVSTKNTKEEKFDLNTFNTPSIFDAILKFQQNLECLNYGIRNQ